MTNFEKIKLMSKEELTAEIIDVLPPSCSCEVCWLRDICEKKESCAKSVKKHLMMGKGKISKWLESEADEK